jgi:hypothetical protein
LLSLPTKWKTIKVLTLLAPVQDQTQQRCDTGHKILNGLGNGCIAGISPNGAVGWRVHVLALGKPKGLLSPSPFNGYLEYRILRHGHFTGRSHWKVLLNNLAEQESRVAVKGDFASLKA